MPAMDGHQLIRCIRTLDAERGGRTPAAALTAYATPADRTRALLAGFQVYLAKPFDPSELVTRSEEHTSELQSRLHLVCRLLLEKKKKKTTTSRNNSTMRT